MMIHDWNSPRVIATLAVAVMVLPSIAEAHEDAFAPLAAVEKVYATSKPLGRVRVVYSRAEAGKPESLLVECDLFRKTVPVEGLADLPTPDWSAFHALYSMTSYENGEWTERPYFYLRVPLRGRRGEHWEQIWAEFHFNADGKLSRKIKRSFTETAPGTVSQIWRDWEIGSGQSAEAVLGAGRKE